MFQFGSDRLVSVLFSLGSSIYQIIFLHLYPPFLILNFEFRFSLQTPLQTEFRPIWIISILDPPFLIDIIIIIDYNYNGVI